MGGVASDPTLEATTSPQRPAWAALAVLLLLLTALLPLPGVNQEAALASMGRTSHLWVTYVAAWPPAFSPLSTGLLGLVLARFALGLVVNLDDPKPGDVLWSRAVASLYVLGASLGGLALGLTLDDRFPDLATGNAVTSAILAAVSTAAAAALLWSLADLIRASRVGNGALVLFGAWEGLQSLRYVLELLAAADVGEPDLMPLVVHNGTLPVALVLLALWRWLPERWPQHVVRGHSVLAPLDLLILPLVVGALCGTIAGDLVGYPTWTPQPPLYAPGLMARTLGALITVPIIGAWCRRRAGAPGGGPWAVGAMSVAGLTLSMALVVWLRAPGSVG